MPRFYLIDHSLQGIGGHHYDYAVHMLQAAQQAGFEPVLATHRRFRPQGQLPTDWPVWPLFAHDTYSRFALYAGSRSRGSGNRLTRNHQESRGLFGGWRGWFDRWARRRRWNRFARACQRLFREVPLAPGDQVFVPTLSEFDLLGLAQFLESTPNTTAVDWHLQFHFNLFEGRPPEYTAQSERLAAMRRPFEEVLSRLPHHRLHFYNTTKQVSEQYNRLGIAAFHPLPYPVNQAFAEPEQKDLADQVALNRPLRVTCPGAIRKEKGQQQLSRLLEELWDDCFAPGRLQLVVQSNKRWFKLPLPEGAQECPPNSDSGPVVYVPHPLPIERYVELLKGADVGLLMYDAVRYYARCAGVLCELLAAGVPVIVPAGCWLAEQIAEPIYAHQQRLAEELPLVDKTRCGQIECGGEGRPHSLALDVPPGATELCVLFRWQTPTEPGTYLRLTTEPTAPNQSSPRVSTIVGRRKESQRVPAWFHLPRGAKRVTLRWENAYHDARATLDEVELSFHGAAETGGSCPAGAVGLIAASPDDVGTLLRDMAEHWPHYRHTAREFSRQWTHQHAPLRTIELLLAHSARDSNRNRAA